MAKLRVSVSGVFSLEFTCDSYRKVRRRAMNFVGDASRLKMTCRTSVEGSELSFCDPDDEDELENFASLAWNAEVDGFFFDNADYEVYAKTEGNFRNIRVVSRFRADEGDRKFARYEGGRVRSGTLNFGNDIGWFEFSLAYDDEAGTSHAYTFTGEVLSQKLDSRRDFKTLLEDVEHRYALLAADYLKNTFHAFDRTEKKGEDTPDLVWWNLFEAERNRFFKAVRTILERPRMRLHGEVEYRRADQLKHLTPALENELAEFRRMPAHLYRREFRSPSHDTPENRFVKYAIGYVSRKYGELCDMIVRSSEFGGRISQSEKDRFDGNRRQLKAFLSHPFFRGVGRFTGLRQLSLTLQNAPGYASVFRTYAILNASYMLFEGLHRIETKNVADLYEIWCFLKVEEIVKACCKVRYGEHLPEPEANHGELNGKFVKQLGTGVNSQVVFKVGDVELARVIYNPKISEHERRNNGLQDVVFPTGVSKQKGQIPDIVLQLTRESGNVRLDKRGVPVSDKSAERFRLTYLFDAKYRVEDVCGEDESNATRPPQDAIDQMHRYRDAIYYAEKGNDKSLLPADLKREVIGGYVLFPGQSQGSMEKPETGKDRRPRFFKSIDQVNIGAIPLRPNRVKEQNYLYQFIDKLLLETPTVDAALDRLNPQHGAALENPSQSGVEEALLCGTFTERQLPWIQRHGRYNLPKDTARDIGIWSLDDASRKRLLVLMSARGYLKPVGSPYRIARVEEVTKEQLWHDPQHPYFKEPRHDVYYLFHVQPLVAPLANLAQRLKIVTLAKGGVCKGVREKARTIGVDVVEARHLDEAMRLADGVVLWDCNGRVHPDLRGTLELAELRMKSHQPLAMDMRWKKSQKTMVHWLRTLLKQVTDRKYVLFIDGRSGDPRHDLEEQAANFFEAISQQV